ncbi:hypothetical protein MAHJHV61_37110 [Mycobacterium avium subsp. hominissuis]
MLSRCQDCGGLLEVQIVRCADVHDIDVIGGEDFLYGGGALRAEALRGALTALRGAATDRGELAAGTMDGVGVHRANHPSADDCAAWWFWLAHR